jgi:hypothetical protein
MVKETWMENKIIEMESKRFDDNWSKKHEEQFQCLLKIYRTGDFSKYNIKQINKKLANISK